MRVRLFRSDANQQWYFSIIGDNGEIVASSEGYSRRIDAEETARGLVDDGTEFEVAE